MVRTAAESPGAYEPVETMQLVGGATCLDFVNTGSRRLRGPFRERLGTYGDLVTWAERVGIADAAMASGLRTESARRPEEAERVLDRARVLRESIYRLFRALGREEAVAAEDLEVLNEELSRAGPARRLVRAGTGVEESWSPGLELERLLWPVTASAAELLAEGDVERVKECGSENCNWLFYDGSRNRSRRWCEMRDCGNRAKAKRYYARHRHGGE